MKFPMALVFASCLLAAPAPAETIPAVPLAAGPVLCRISTENGPAHFQAKALRRFSELIAVRSNGTILVEFHESGKLYRDADAVGAIARGELEIAAPGIWQLDKLVPDTAVLMLPSMFAKPREIIRAVVDGPVGAALSSDLEESMRAVVLGPWLDLGYGHIFGTAVRIRSIAEIRGRSIRVAGGKGNEERIKALGGLPVSIPLLDLPAYLERRLVDGVLTTYETVESAALDSHGVRSVLEDNQYYPFYVPVAGKAFWARLDEGQRQAIRGAWAEVVVDAREEAVRAQEAAKRSLVERGLTVYRPTAEESSKTHAALLAREDEIAERLNVSADLLAQLRRELGKAERR